MKEKSRVAKAYGALFLAIGILWLSAIFVRCEGFLPRKKQHAFSYQKIQQQLTEYLEPLSLRKHVPKILIAQFWILAHWEFACAFFYLLSGLSLLRAYPFGRRFAAYTLMADIVLKTLIVTYQQFLLLPLRSIFQETNVMVMYFTPDAGLAAKGSSYLTGIKLIQPGAFYYGFFYALFLLVSIYVFTHPKMKEHFKKGQ